MNYFSDLKIFYSNCIYKGNAWTQAQSSQLLEQIKIELNTINNLEFKGINVNTMRGETQNFQVTILSTFSDFKNNIDLFESLDLNERVRRAATRIKGFHFGEIRIEHARHRSVFADFNHPELLKEF